MTHLAVDLASALDPLSLAAEVGLQLDDWQAGVLMSPSRRMLLNCARQTGKSTVTALRAVHEAAFNPGSLTLALSPALRQSTELLLKARTFASELGLELVGDSATRLELRNGSRVISLPGSERTTRGYSAPSLVILDEAARIDDDLIASVRPMLATSGGSLIALSTPAGKRGWFWECWSNGEGWQRFQVRATDCPRISEQFLRDELRELGPLRFAAEFECAFVDDQAAAFPTHLIDAAFTPEVALLWAA